MESAHPFVPPHVMLCEKGPTRCPKTQDSIETLVGRSPWTCTQGSDFWSHIGNRYLLGREALSLQAFWTLSPRDNLCLIFFFPAPVHPGRQNSRAPLSSLDPSGVPS